MIYVRACTRNAECTAKSRSADKRSKLDRVAQPIISRQAHYIARQSAYICNDKQCQRPAAHHYAITSIQAETTLASIAAVVHRPTIYAGAAAPVCVSEVDAAAAVVDLAPSLGVPVSVVLPRWLDNKGVEAAGSWLTTTPEEAALNADDPIVAALPPTDSEIVVLAFCTITCPSLADVMLTPSSALVERADVSEAGIVMVLSALPKTSDEASEAEVMTVNVCPLVLMTVLGTFESVGSLAALWDDVPAVAVSLVALAPVEEA